MLTNRFLKIIPLSTAFLLMIACLVFARTDHKDYNSGKLDTCRDCHSGSGEMNSHGGFREHRVLAERAGTNCSDCHQQSFCLDCHKGGNIEAYKEKSLSRRGETMPTTHRSDFISIHSVKAKDDPQNCYRCHESRFCSDCHGQVPNKGSMSIKSHFAVGNTQRYFLTNASTPADFAAHAVEARRNLQSCEGCHPDGVVCTQCHTVSAPFARALRGRQSR